MSKQVLVATISVGITSLWWGYHSNEGQIAGNIIVTLIVIGIWCACNHES